MSVSCLTGCGGSGTGSADNTSKVETKQTEETGEVDKNETSEFATVIVESLDGSKKLAVTYNDTFFDCSYEVGYDANFLVTDTLINAIFDEEDGLLEEYADVPENFCGGGFFQFHSNYSVNDYYIERSGSLPQYSMETSELEQITISGKTAYVFEEFSNDRSICTTNVMFDIDGNMLIFIMSNGSLIDENGTILDVEAFFVDAKVVE